MMSGKKNQHSTFSDITLLSKKEEEKNRETGIEIIGELFLGVLICVNSIRPRRISLIFSFRILRQD